MPSKNRHHHIPLWQIAPFLFLPPALIAGVSLYLDLQPTLFLHTSILCAVALLLLVTPRMGPRWALAGASLGLVIVALSWAGEWSATATFALSGAQFNWWAGISALFLGALGLFFGR